MENLNYTLKELLFESRRKDIIEKYRDRLTDTLNAEPTPINGMMEDDFDKVVEYIESELPHPKYLEFVLDSLCCGGYGADPETVLPLIQNFHKLAERNLIKNKDIYSKEYATPQDSQYHPYVDLSNLADAVNKAKELEKEKETEKQIKSQRDVIYDGDRWTVIVPKSHLASCKYGAGTKWCTTTKDNDSYFKKYTSQGILFYILDKNDIPTLQSQGIVTDNRMYKMALNWEYILKTDGNISKFFPTNMYNNRTCKLYDIKDNEIHTSNVLPLLPLDMIQSITDYYESVIEGRNKKIKEEENRVKYLLNDFQQRLVDAGVVKMFMDKLEKDLPKEQVVKLNGGLDDFETDVNTHTFWFTLRDYTSNEMEVSEDTEAIYSGFILGIQDYTAREQFLDLNLTDENGEEIDSDEVLMGKDGFGEVFGSSFIRDARSGFVSWEQWLKYLSTKKDEFFNVNPNIIVNFLYKKVINFIRDNSWRREWRGENSGKTYFESINGEVYWVPANCSSTYVFKYPLKEGTTSSNFIEYIKENPGSTSKQFYWDVYQKDYFPGLNSALTPSLRDAGIVKTKKGRRGELKYYLGPNYRKWTQGRVHRYRLQCIPMKWKTR